MNEQELKRRLQQSLPRGEAPPFDESWARAQIEARRPNRRYGFLAAAVALLAVTVGLFWPSQEEIVTNDFLIAESILNSTRWTAPSDVLMPRHQFDIYREIPLPMESTDLNEGTLL